MGLRLKTVLRMGVLAPLCALTLSCRKNTDIARSETVRFYSAGNPDKSITYLQIPLEGVSEGEICIESNTPVEVETVLPVKDVLGADPWISISVTPEGDRNYTVKYSAKALKGDLTSRSACLNATSTSMYLGSYLKICQGYDLFWAEDAAAEHILSASAPTYTIVTIPSIAATSYDYISFNAYAVNPEAVSTKEVYPLELSIPEGTYFAQTGLETFILDVPLADSFGDSNLLYLPFRSVADGFSSETTVTFRSAYSGETPPTLHIGNIKVYKVSDQLREVLDGGDYEEMGGEDIEVE